MSVQQNHGPWLLSYAHDRRAHKHRCWCCGRILQTGDSVWMARTGNRQTKAIHEACGTTHFGGGESEWNYLEALAVQIALWWNPKLTDRELTAQARAVVVSATRTSSSTHPN